ncbi:MAG TPA: single-stranded-DNA-specific exonuclease RecJ [Bacillota bacterium]|jgi:single-stranded-DNA-specific exonuclease|nr:single-stranded-DNA-specific exonuclease RecJ [Bacillota bacterium]HOB87012.1 single-stranded-DNA-specific exonuclease RecJ [Bacillota bacterium]HOP69832.1 single-stranded-DNA-specific exonuclease RecJ [Bacillota bacterium]HPT34830.1 single-stranded-DNA-specific exonuclease RecJ [Bacillota bacterium]HPZ64178.1 single-stranded-DNA-specific exonuclease RecJ [Bacillota bacterium]
MIKSSKRWLTPPPADPAVEMLAGALDIPPALARVLVNRGLTSVKEARDFLHPSREQLLSPWLMKGMEAAVDRLLRALDQGEPVVVYGDYDADGITATAILVETLTGLGGEVDFYLPSRFEEGYGLHREALSRIREERGKALLVTVDCGINAVEEAAFAREIGLDLVITDHHQPLGEPPPAAALINPLQEGCPYPCKHLSGAGIAFKIAAALMERCGRPFPWEQLDLAALGTVADVVPLLQENRVLVALGLEEVRRSRRVGLKALMEACSLKPEQMESGALAFIIAPSLNAAGRMGEADPAVELLLEREEEKARVLAASLRQENQNRRATEQKILEEAVAMVEARPEEAGEKVITLAGEGWHRGVIGIVASRLVERFYRPAVLVAVDREGIGHGSARSVPGFNITGALAACADLLHKFGGHQLAAGLTMEARHIGELRRRLNSPPLSPPEEAMIPSLKLEGELGPEEIQLELAGQLARLQPFGEGNPPPLFYSPAWRVKSWRRVGNGQKHLKLSLWKDNRVLRPIYFSAASLADSLLPDLEVDLAFALEQGIYLGRPILNVEIKDLRASSRGGLVAAVVDRRGCRDRLACLRRLAAEGKPLAVFVATRSRGESIKKQLSGEADLAFLTSGGDNGDRESLLSRKELVLFDLPLHQKLLRPFFEGRREPCRVHLLYGAPDRELNRQLIDLSLPSEEALQEVCRALQEGAAGLEQGEDRPVRRLRRRCLKILDEAGILKGLPAGEPVFSGKGELSAERLAASRSYREACRLRKECLDFQERLLAEAPEELARYWNAIYNPGQEAGGDHDR